LRVDPFIPPTRPGIGQSSLRRPVVASPSICRRQTGCGGS
jgi:hypothetical protein